jgi:hypothetical protein
MSRRKPSLSKALRRRFGHHFGYWRKARSCPLPAPPKAAAFDGGTGGRHVTIVLMKTNFSQ